MLDAACIAPFAMSHHLQSLPRSVSRFFTFPSRARDMTSYLSYLSHWNIIRVARVRSKRRIVPDAGGWQAKNRNKTAGRAIKDFVLSQIQIFLWKYSREKITTSSFCPKSAPFVLPQRALSSSQRQRILRMMLYTRIDISRCRLSFLFSPRRHWNINREDADQCARDVTARNGGSCFDAYTLAGQYVNVPPAYRSYHSVWNSLRYPSTREGPSRAALTPPRSKMSLGDVETTAAGRVSGYPVWQQTPVDSSGVLTRLTRCRAERVNKGEREAREGKR